jgi:hypothetical protein
VLLAITRLLFKGGKLSKLGLAGLVWSFTPRTLKIVAAGVVMAATIVLLGAIAAIALLALQVIYPGRLMRKAWPAASPGLTLALVQVGK